MGTTIRLTRSGGLAGIDMVASVDVEDLPAATGASVRSAVARLGGERASAAPAPAPGADRYQYDLVIETHGERRSVSAHDGALTPEVQAIVDALLPLAQPG